MRNKNTNLKNWLKLHFPKFGNLSKVIKFGVGQSNPTYLLIFKEKKIVLRSKPLGNLLKGAHRIDREFKVMKSLRNSKIPVPTMIQYCNDENVIGSEFFLMNYVDGVIEKNPDLKNYTKAQKEKIYDKKIELLISLANLDLNSLNLDNYGKSTNFLKRQIDLWISQYRSSQTKYISSMEFLINNLSNNIPEIIDKLTPVLTHGDFRLDNMILSRNNEILALLDWELSTLAPPFIDLSYWCLMLRFEKNWPISGLGFNSATKRDLGIPSEKKILDTYSKRLGYEIGKSWNFLLAFNSFRFAGILQGITKRVEEGNNAGTNAEEVGLLTEPVANIGKHFLELYL